ncbi:MAG: CoB--CoM heterodisulfide reductase iron-sulfur subunit A family protein [bacterium]
MARIGVFVCHCGVNISGIVNCPSVASELLKIPGVVYTRDYQYMCSLPGQSLIKEAIKNYGLNRIVVSACSPRMHEETFRNCISEAGLNPYLFEMANIREQCSWVHQDKEKATKKAIELTRMAVFKVAKNIPLTKLKAGVCKKGCVIGGGIAGIQAGLDLANAGISTIIVERTPSIGGKMAQLDKTFPTLDCSACILTPKMVEASRHKNIKIYTYSEIEEVSGFMGNFKVKIRKKARSIDESKCTGCGLCLEKCPVKIPSEFNMGLGNRGAIYIPFPQAVPRIPTIDRENCLYFTKKRCGLCKKACDRDAINYYQEDEIITEDVGAIIVATGFSLFDHSVYGEYGGGRFKDILSSLSFERLINASGPTKGHIKRPSDGKEPKSVAFIQCIGCRDDAKGISYCGRFCCMYTAKQAILLREHIPDCKVHIFYIDIRAAGKGYEEFVEKARTKYGISYIRGRVSKIYQKKDRLVVKGADTLAGIPLSVEVDMVVLANGAIPQKDSKTLAQILKIPYDEYGFFTELHPKLAPSETTTGGIFLAGSCQFPKDIPDCVQSAGAASSKAISLVSKDSLEIEPVISRVNPEFCKACFSCIDVCAYSAIEKQEIKGRVSAKINPALCHGCGSCLSICRCSAISLDGFSSFSIFNQIEALSEMYEGF